MRSFGLPYVGSKNRLAGRICSLLPAGQRLVDLFAGGCAVTDCAMLCGKWQSVLAIDVNERPLRLFRACVDRKPLPWAYISRARFMAERRSLTYAQQLIWSYGCMQRGYVYTPAEADALAGVLAYIGDGAACGDAPIYKRPLQRLQYAIDHRLAGDSQLSPYQRLLRMLAIGRPAGQQHLFGPAKLRVRVADWRAYRPRPGDVVYADPPYIGTDQSGYNQPRWGADEYGALVDRLRSAGVPAYVSEYQAPPINGVQLVGRWPVVDKLARCRQSPKFECLYKVA